MKTAQAGTLESSDVMITLLLQDSGEGIKIDIDSNVLAQYGEAIHAVITTTLSEEDVKDVWVKVVDRGALDYTIKARLLTALDRAHATRRAE